MKKFRILTALSALALTGSLLAAPFSVTAAVKIPRVYRYYAFGAMKYLLYDTKNQNWYNETGDALSVTQTDRQQVRFQGEIYTADFEEMKVYNAENEEVPALSDFLAESMQQGKDALSICLAENGEITEMLPKNVVKPVYMQAADLSNPKQDYFSFAFSVNGTEEGSYAWSSLQKSTEKIMKDGLDPDAVTFDQPEYWHIETIVACSVSTLESYTDTGDVNLDGKFTVADSVLTARAAAEDETAKISELGISLADMDEDGELTVLDVTESLKALAGTDSESMKTE